MIKKFIAKAALIWKLWLANITFNSSYPKMEESINKTSKSEYIIKHTLFSK